MRRVRLAGRRQGSLAAQVLGVFLVAVLVPLGVALVQLRGELRQAEDQATADAGSVALLAADEVGDTVGEATAAAETIAAMPSFWSGSDEDRDLVLAALADPRPAFNALVYYTDDFAQHGSSNPTARGPRSDAASPAFAREAVATGAAALSAEPLLSPSDQQPVIPIAMPLRGGSDRGLLVARLQIARLPELWRSVAVPPGTTLAMIDTRSGRVLAGGRGVEPLPTRRVSDRTIERIAAGERSFRTTSSEDGSARIVAWAPVAGTPGSSRSGCRLSQWSRRSSVRQ